MTPLVLLMCALPKPGRVILHQDFGIADLVSILAYPGAGCRLGLSDGALLQINDNRLTFHCTVAHACRGTSLVTFLT